MSRTDQGDSAILSLTDYEQFRRQVESQTPRVLKRFLDFDKRLRSRQGLGEFRQWLGKILLDNGAVYTIEDRAKGFEVLSCLEIAAQWESVVAVVPESITLAGSVDKTRLYRSILDSRSALERRAAMGELLRMKYRKTWSWIAGCAKHMPSDGVSESPQQLTVEFLNLLDALDPLEAGSTPREVERLEAQVTEHEETLRRVSRELDVARERADRALERLESRDAELGGLNKQLQAERENGDKLRQERSRRIKIEREAREKGKELDDLRAEFVKLDGRLREVSGKGISGGLDLTSLRNLDAGRILGVGTPPAAEEISQLRRRFASAFHSNRANQLPDWVSQLFDQLLGIVNEACDRIRK